MSLIQAEIVKVDVCLNNEAVLLFHYIIVSEIPLKVAVQMRLVSDCVMDNNVMLAYLLYGAVLEKLVRKFPRFYETKKFVTVFTSARHLALS